MENRYNVITGDTLSVSITTSVEEKCIPVEKHFSKKLTVQGLKDKLEVLTAANPASMTVKAYDNENHLVCVLDDNKALIGSYPIDNGMRLHVEDSFALKKLLEDESNVEKYTMPPEEYEKRSELYLNNQTSSPAVCVSSSTSTPQRGVALSRGRGHNKNSMERLHSVEVKALRRPILSPNAVVKQCISDENTSVKSISQSDDDTFSDSLLSSSTTQTNLRRPTHEPGEIVEVMRYKTEDGALSLDVLPNRTLSSSDEHVDTSKTIIETKSLNSSFGKNIESVLNPDAEEFVPSFASNSPSTVNKKRSEIEIIDPRTGKPVSLDDCSTDPFGSDGFEDDSECKVDKAIKSVSAAALSIDSNPTGVKYEQEVNDILELMENLLTNNPGLFSTIMEAPSSNDIFYRWAGFELTLKVVAQKILKQSTSLTTSFSYFGAKICSELDKITISIGRHPSFRYYILNECETVHQQLEQLVTTEEKKAHAIVMFFAELYIQLEIVRQEVKERIKPLGLGLIGGLAVLLSNPTPSNVCCLCKILKLSGWAIDEDHSEQLKKLIGDLCRLKNSNRFDTLTVNMLNSVINLSTSSWGRNVNNNVNNNKSCSGSSSRSNTGASNQHKTNTDGNNSGDGIYNADGIILTEEEFKFLNDNYKLQSDFDGEDFEDYEGFDLNEEDLVSDDLDDEVCEAYEQFLLTVPNSNRIKK